MSGQLAVCSKIEMIMKTITYIYRGGVERGTGSGYVWHDGYSPNSDDGHMTAPWMTKRECQSDAKQRGAIAIFEVPVGRLPAEAL